MNKIITTIAAAAIGLAAVSCSDSRSYAELLTDENHYVNHYLADHRLIGSVPADSVFETGENAPYYQMDSEGNVFMQVIDAGNPDNRPSTGDRVYFRFTRYNLSTYETGVEMTGVGNSDDIIGDNGIGSVYFLLGNTTLQSSTQFGVGIQVPMLYLGDNAHVKLVVKSQYGWTNETANVIPYLYDISYYSSPLSPWSPKDDSAKESDQHN